MYNSFAVLNTYVYLRKHIYHLFIHLFVDAYLRKLQQKLLKKLQDLLQLGSRSIIVLCYDITNSEIHFTNELIIQIL